MILRAAVGLVVLPFELSSGHIDFSLDSVDMSTKLTKDLPLRLPVVSSPMDTVTEHQMAIGIALMG